MISEKHLHTNSLVHETSPYLLQHAHNPVNWYAWNANSLQKAKNENKILLISIGYSACHWCHVMERECFENESAAALMNEHFVCIKVDREERPDIDQIYMSAVQLMTGSGGWPLNCFALPDGKPIYGGTYFPLDKWKNILFSIADIYKNAPEKVLEYAEKLTAGIQNSDWVREDHSKEEISGEFLHRCYMNWEKYFDNKEGGPNKSPKFPLPNNYLFLLRYHALSQQKSIDEHVHLTLKKMAFGGIFDQIGGGFSRYSTDSYWKVPHFEKMLYDNAQLISLYSEAFQARKNPLYQEVVEKTIAFVERELKAPSGGFYSALDADSEGEEGKYYVWKKKELIELLGNNFDVYSHYYNVNSDGHWEHDNFILLRTKSDEEIALACGFTITELNEKINYCNQILLEERQKRKAPGLDDKTLCSWNALMIKAYTDAYRVFEKAEYLEKAKSGMDFLFKEMSNGLKLFHSNKNRKSTINGFLEDYCFVIEALIDLYETTFEASFLMKAKDFMNEVIRLFSDEKNTFFYFTSSEDEALIARKMELSDNVIPASNSCMALNLFRLGKHLSNPDYLSRAKEMLMRMMDRMEDYMAGYSNWAILHLNLCSPFYEIAIMGAQAEGFRKEFEKNYLPNKLITGSAQGSELPLLKNKFEQDKTCVYVCSNNTCSAPAESVDESLQWIETKVH